jgi:hypothetical protein
MGGRPWVLNKKLSADFYVGLDVGGDKNARVACYTFFDGYGNMSGKNGARREQRRLTHRNSGELLLMLSQLMATR